MANDRKASKPFDAANYLASKDDVALYITEALQTHDVEYIAHAIGVAAKARGMTQIAEQTGLSRESLYRALSTEGRPQFDTIQRVLMALGLQLKVEAAENSKEPA